MEIKRNIYLNKLISKKHNGLIKVVTGIRRCGKSYLLFNLFKDHLLAEGAAGRLYELTDDSGTAWYPAAGSRNSGTAVLQSTGNNGGYWSASTSGGNGVLLYFSNSSVYPVGNNSRAYGFSVRCVHK